MTGLGLVQRQVRRAFLAWPDRQYLTAELIEWAYPRLPGKPERKHRVAVVRAASKVADRVERQWRGRRQPKDWKGTRWWMRG